MEHPYELSLRPAPVAPLASQLAPRGTYAACGTLQTKGPTVNANMDNEARASLRHFLSAALIFGKSLDDKRDARTRALEAFDEWFALHASAKEFPRLGVGTTEKAVREVGSWGLPTNDSPAAGNSLEDLALLIQLCDRLADEGESSMYHADTLAQRNAVVRRLRELLSAPGVKGAGRG